MTNVPNESECMTAKQERLRAEQSLLLVRHARREKVIKVLRIVAAVIWCAIYSFITYMSYNGLNYTSMMYEFNIRKLLIAMVAAIVSLPLILVGAGIFAEKAYRGLLRLGTMRLAYINVICLILLGLSCIFTIFVERRVLDNVKLKERADNISVELHRLEYNRDTMFAQSDKVIIPTAKPLSSRKRPENDD